MDRPVAAHAWSVYQSFESTEKKRGARDAARSASFERNSSSGRSQRNSPCTLKCVRDVVRQR